MCCHSPFRLMMCAVLAAAPVALVAAEPSWVGKTLPPYPTGYDELQGVCITGGLSSNHVCDYGLQVIGRPATDPNLAATPTQVLASRNIESGAASARWRVTDAVAVPKPRKGYALQIGSCRFDRVDASVVAFVRHGDREVSRDVLWARRLDTASGKLVPIAIKRVDCINEGFGV
jgi:hypothetical protein